MILLPSSKKRPIFELYLNEIAVNVSVSQLKGPLDSFNNLVQNSEINFRTGYFMYNKQAYWNILLKFPIDLVFVDKSNIVVATKMLAPGKISEHYPDSFKIYIFPIKTIRFFNIKIGDVIQHFTNWSKRLSGKYERLEN